MLEKTAKRKAREANREERDMNMGEPRMGEYRRCHPPQAQGLTLVVPSQLNK